jgi:hypothetical protein
MTKVWQMATFTVPVSPEAQKDKSDENAKMRPRNLRNIMGTSIG